MKIDLTGKTAVITGAARGIGKAIGLAFAEHGADVVIMDIKMSEALSAAEEVRKLGRRAEAVVVDVSNSSEVNAGFKSVFDQFGHVDILVNNAGIYPESLVVDMAEEEWDKVVGISLKGAFNCSKAVLREMINRKDGRIISISSRAGRRGSKGHAHYAAAKAGIVGLTMSLAREVGPYGVTANAIAPGIIETEMTRELLERGGRNLSDYVVGHYGKPEDVVGIALVLASKYGSYITGAVIDVNGGSWMGA